MRGRRTARTSALRPRLLERIAPDVLDLSPTLFANGNRTANIARARELLGAVPRVAGPEEKKAATPDEPRVLPCPCSDALIPGSSGPPPYRP